MAKKKSTKQDAATMAAVLPKKTKNKKALPKGKVGDSLTNKKLRELMAKEKPPQNWYDEDQEGLF